MKNEIKNLAIVLISCAFLAACSNNNDPEYEISNEETSIDNVDDSLTTKANTKIKIDGYNAIAIEDQIWMAENLNVDKFRDGTKIPEAKTNEDWIKAAQEGKPVWCYYKNDASNSAELGKLYNWFAVMSTHGLAPVGWHIPNELEWVKLFKSIGECSVFKIKSEFSWKNDDTKPTNITGFSLLPIESRRINGNFFGVGADLWSSSEISDIEAFSICIANNNDCKIGVKEFKGSGLTVRCIKD